jgi:hypothetical protein
VESRGWRNEVGKSVATTNLINALARYHKVDCTRRRSGSGTSES